MHYAAAPLLLLASLLVGCGDEATQRDVVPPGREAPGRLPDAEMQRLVDSVDYVDLLFHELAFSMSLDDAKAVQYAIAHIGERPADPAPGCAPIGRVFYQISGRAAAEADLYFSPGCTYLAFVDDAGAVEYANVLSDLGKEFYNNQFSRLIDGYTPVP